MQKPSRLRVAFRGPLAKLAATMVAVVLLLAVFGPIIWGTAANTPNTANLYAPPSLEHWAGTDALGRDLFARVLVATRLTIGLALIASAIGVGVGIILGSAPFLLGPVVGKAVVWFIGIAVAFPGILLALFFAVLFGTGATSAALALGLASAPGFARLAHTLISSILARDFVAAAQVGGIGRLRILARHILPNIGEPLVVNATIGAGNVLLSFAGLSFLGLGVQSPQYDWGRLMNECLQSIYTYPIASLTPGLAVVIAGLAFNLTGESIAQSLGVTALGDLGWRGKLRPATPAAAAPLPATEAADQDAVLSVRDLAVAFPAGDQLLTPVRGVSFDLHAGEAVGLVGESGSGKTLTALSVAQLVDNPGIVTATRMWFCGTPLLGPDTETTDAGQTLPSQTASPAEIRHLLGTSLAMVFQDPMTSLNPTMKVGEQLAELGREHGGYDRAAALQRAVERLGAVRIDDPEKRAKQYPHELSGGMRQRAMIGMGVMLNPRLIIADEPTTALDVTVQEQVLDLLNSIRRTDDVALLLISHDISVVSEVCDRILVMYAGRIVEDLPTPQLAQAAHPYTQLLVAAVPTMHTALDQPLATIPGRPPEPGAITGCAFAPRCPLADAHCRESDPVLEPVSGGIRAACWHAGERVELPVEVVG